MKIGDLVRLGERFRYSVYHKEVGLIIYESPVNDITSSRRNFRIQWSSWQNWFHEEALELVSESR